jgi:hypothetical protein
MEKIAWTEFVRNYEVLRGVEENRNILHTEQEYPAYRTGISCTQNRNILHTEQEYPAYNKT